MIMTSKIPLDGNPQRIGRILTLVAPALLILLAPHASFADQAIETETARPLGNGNLEVGAAWEFQRSSTGVENAVPFAIEIGIGDRFEFLVEPVAVTAIRPKGTMNGTDATGVGDLELTLFGLVAHENGILPAISLAVEGKLPTARNLQIGTGKADLAFYLIASKKVGPFDIHANFGYTIIGQPMGVTANNIFNFALAGILPINKHVEVFAEAYGNTAAAPDGESGDAGGVVLVPELASGEVVGSGGVAWNVNHSVSLSLGASYDTNSAFQLRTGLTFATKAF